MLPEIQIVENLGVRYAIFQSRDFISHIVRQTGQFELALVEDTEKLLKDVNEGYVLDIGSNMGTYGVPLAVRNPNLTVLCFEPQRIIYNQLCTNITINRLDNVYAYNVAVSDHEDTIELKMPDYMQEENIGGFSLDPLVKEKCPTSQGKTETVNVVTIDSIGLANVKMIKIDVEGLELEVLKGATETIKNSNYPPLILEAWNQYEWWDARKEEMFDYVKSLGYNIEDSSWVNNYLAVHPGK